METTKNDLPKNTKHFFKSLSDYLDTKLLFFCSIQRNDYIPGHSDIDINIFTDNETATITKLQHFLHVNRSEFKKVEWVMDNIEGHGYKLIYKNPKKNIQAEFLIYNEKFKEITLTKNISKFDLPIYISVLLWLLKFLYYKVNILPRTIYLYLKKALLNVVSTSNDRFIVLNN